MTTTADAPTTTATVQRRGGPALIASALTTVVLFLLSLIAGMAFADSLYASPFAEADDVQRYFTDNPTVIRFVALLQFGSAISLAVFTALAWATLRRLTPTVTGATAVAVVGGITASTFLALNTIVQWTLTQSVVTDQPTVVRALNFLFFGLGGPAHVASLSLLVAGVSIAGRQLKLLPGWFNVASLVVAALAAVSILTLLTQAATTFIPIGRFLTLIWIVAVSFVLRPRRS